MTDDQHDPTTHTERLATDGGTDDAAETPIDQEVVDDVAAGEDVPREDLVDALVVLNAALIGEHSAYEREYEYVTVEGVRAYLVDGGVWETIRDEHDFEDRLARAVQRAHTEQAERLLAADDSTENIDAGIVVGIDTAEVMN